MIKLDASDNIKILENICYNRLLAEFIFFLELTLKWSKTALWLSIHTTVTFLVCLCFKCGCFVLYQFML